MSGSLLLIVAVWLVLLAPLLLRNQRPVRRTARALGDTRVLHSGGTPLQGRRKLRPAPGLYRAEDDEELELVDAEPEYVLLEDPEDLEALDAEVEAEAEELAEVDADAEAGVEAAPTDVDEVTGEVAEPDEVQAEQAQDYRGWDDTDTGQFAPIRVIAGSAKAEAEAAPGDVEGANKDNTDASEDSIQQRRFRAVPQAYVRGGDIHPRADVRDEIRNTDAHSSELALYEDADELSEADLAYLASRRGRGVYDPVASQALVARRLKRRKQVLLALTAAFALTLIAGFVFGGAAWFAPVLTGAFTVLYLVVLRKQAIEEQKLRHRRMARMRRARLGVRNTEDDELGVPDRLQRPGAIIMESDDLDPEFEHLDYVDGSRFFAEGDPYQLRHA